MRKQLAILKDSLRESLDTKVFYVMVALSGVLIVLVASVSFSAASPEDMMTNMLRPVNQPRASENPFAPPKLQGGVVRYQVKKVETAEGTEDSADTYRVVVSGTMLVPPPAGQDKAAEEKKQRQKWDEEIHHQEENLRDHFGDFYGARAVEVTRVRALPPSPGQPPTQVAFELTVRRTKWTSQFWPHTPAILFGLVPLSGIKEPLGLEVASIEDVFVRYLGAWVAVLLSIIITAFFIPNMLRKGTIDLVLVKPIRRTTLLVYKYLGGLIFIFLNTVIAVGGVWLVLGLRSGLWAPGFLILIPVITFFFAILYAVSALFGVLTRSAIVSILLACGTWFLLWLVGQAYVFFKVMPLIEEASRTPVEQRLSEGWWVSVVNGIHFILPRTTDLDALSSSMIATSLFPSPQADIRASNLDINWGESIMVSLAFIAVMLGLACWRFATKDY
jgi:ABC-type transport system involved in multi-copper enzyme maturation permease subunit